MNRAVDCVLPSKSDGVSGDFVFPSAGPIRIMPLGDSITRGLTIPGPVPGGYRTRLYKRLAEELLPVAGVVFVGSQNDNPDPEKLPSPWHEGRGGWRVDEHLATAEAAIQASFPSVVLLHLGTNDAVQNFHMPDAPSRLNTLIEKIVTLSPETRVIVAQIIDSTDDGTRARVKDYNAAVPPLVQALQQARHYVTLVDMFPVISPENFADPYHPNKEGYDQIADAWFTAIQALGSLSNPPVPAPAV